MSPQIIQQIAAFLGRATLRGEEVDAFNACMNALQAEFARLTSTEQPSETAGSET